MRIAVIGAGPAGSRAAAGLARAGHEVSLFDRTFDREKPCGGGVPCLGLGSLADAVRLIPDRDDMGSRGRTALDPAMPKATDRGSQHQVMPVTRPEERGGSTRASVPGAHGSSVTSPTACDREIVSPAQGVRVRRIVFEAPSGRSAELLLDRPIAVFSRRALDAALLSGARRSGARLIERGVSSLEPAGEGWTISSSGGGTEAFDHLIGADGARSLVRRVLARPFAAEEVSQAVGWYVPARTSDTMTIRFDSRIAGYLWVFPRPDHLAIGACAPLRPGVVETLWATGRDLLRSQGIGEDGLARYSALIPSLGSGGLRTNTVSGPGWSLIGDAAGCVDPLTREGIRHALVSSDLLLEAFAAREPSRYGDDWKAAFLPEFAWAARHRDQFFAPHHTERLVDFLGRSRAVRDVVVDLVVGAQDYLSLKRRLLRAAVPAGVQLGLSLLRASR